MFREAQLQELPSWRNPLLEKSNCLSLSNKKNSGEESEASEKCKRRRVPSKRYENKEESLFECTNEQSERTEMSQKETHDEDTHSNKHLKNSQSEIIEEDKEIFKNRSHSTKNFENKRPNPNEQNKYKRNSLMSFSNQDSKFLFLSILLISGT